MYDVHTPRGTIRTPLVVYATNAYTSHLLPHLAGADGIVPVRGQAAAIRANVGYIDEGDAQGITRTGWSGMFALALFVLPFLLNSALFDRQATIVSSTGSLALILLRLQHQKRNVSTAAHSSFLVVREKHSKRRDMECTRLTMRSLILKQASC